MPKRLSLKYRQQPAIVINRIAFKDKKLVYIARANKKIRYPWGRSCIAYIGTTKKGARRIATSAVWKGADILFEYGMKHLDLIIVLCARRQGVETWRKLERALIIRFRERFGAVPKGNNQGKKMHWCDELDYFRTKRLDIILDELSQVHNIK